MVEKGISTSSVFGPSMAPVQSQEAQEQAVFLLWMLNLPSLGSPHGSLV